MTLLLQSEKEIETIKNEIKKDTFRSPEDFSRRFEAFKSKQGQHYNGGTDATIRITDSPDVRVAKSSLQKENISITKTGNGYGTEDNAGTGLTSSSTSDWNKDFQFFITPQ